MGKAKTPKPDNPEQSKRFIKTAREIGVDESADAFDRAFNKVVRTTSSKTVSPIKRITEGK